MSNKIKIGDCFFPNTEPDECMVLDYVDPIGYSYLAKNGERGKQFYTGKIVPIPTLHLPIGNNFIKYGGEWFSMILNGVKKEEYREVKGFNAKRLAEKYGHAIWHDAQVPHEQITVGSFKPWKVLHLTNGYGHSKPQLWAHIESISIGRGNPEWGAPTDRDVFIIRLGDVFHTKNLKP